MNLFFFNIITINLYNKLIIKIKKQVKKMIFDYIISLPEYIRCMLIMFCMIYMYSYTGLSLSSLIYGSKAKNASLGDLYPLLISEGVISLLSLVILFICLMFNESIPTNSLRYQSIKLTRKKLKIISLCLPFIIFLIICSGLIIPIYALITVDFKSNYNSNSNSNWLYYKFTYIYMIYQLTSMVILMPIIICLQFEIKRILNGDYNCDDNSNDNGDSNNSFGDGIGDVIYNV